MKALLSVFDKIGIEEFATGLHNLGWELLSSGGTAKQIAEAGIPVTDVADYTGSPIMLGHRVVTLHPKVHGGILADRENEEHQQDLIDNEIETIDLVVCNLYPFQAEPSIENIDIGGPTMVRAAAKNHQYVGVIVDPADYDVVLVELTNADLSRLAQNKCWHEKHLPTQQVMTQRSLVGWMTRIRAVTQRIHYPIHYIWLLTAFTTYGTEKIRTKLEHVTNSQTVVAGGTKLPSITEKK